MRQYIGVPEVAARYGISAGVVYEWVRNASIPQRKLPGKKMILFDAGDLDLYDDGAIDLVVKRLKGGGRIVRPKVD